MDRHFTAALARHCQAELQSILQILDDHRVTGSGYAKGPTHVLPKALHDFVRRACSISLTSSSALQQLQAPACGSSSELLLPPVSVNLNPTHPLLALCLAEHVRSPVELLFVLDWFVEQLPSLEERTHFFNHILAADKPCMPEPAAELPNGPDFVLHKLLEAASSSGSLWEVLAVCRLCSRKEFKVCRATGMPMPLSDACCGYLAYTSQGWEEAVRASAAARQARKREVPVIAPGYDPFSASIADTHKFVQAHVAYLASRGVLTAAEAGQLVLSMKARFGEEDDTAWDIWRFRHSKGVWGGLKRMYFLV
ncbi:hypothetical protein COO60DRAFT_1673272 [Scenedesmus sp. NREL 46B-D3]|nr:hypothetical protein COO60DRAFT_1673272 [Scenedesmus sp. NREL 46B-D3]